MISIRKFKVLGSKKIHFIFNDNMENTIDFAPFIDENKLSKPMTDATYLQKVELYENGRGFTGRTTLIFALTSCKNISRITSKHSLEKVNATGSKSQFHALNLSILEEIGHSSPRSVLELTNSNVPYYVTR